MVVIASSGIVEVGLGLLSLEPSGKRPMNLADAEARAEPVAISIRSCIFSAEIPLRKSPSFLFFFLFYICACVYVCVSAGNWINSILITCIY